MAGVRGVDREADISWTHADARQRLRILFCGPPGASLAGLRAMCRMSRRRLLPLAGSNRCTRPAWAVTLSCWPSAPPQRRPPPAMPSPTCRERGGWRPTPRRRPWRTTADRRLERRTAGPPAGCRLRPAGRRHIEEYRIERDAAAPRVSTTPAWSRRPGIRFIGGRADEGGDEGRRRPTRRRRRATAGLLDAAAVHHHDGCRPASSPPPGHG